MPAYTPQEMDHRRLMEAARLMRSVPTGGVSDPQTVGVPEPSTEIPVPETPEEQQSLLSQIGSSALSAFGAVGNLLDLPGSMARDVLASLGGDFENPFDQLLSPFSHENRVTGRDLLTQYGITEANKETGMSGWIDDPMEGVRDVGGFLAEVALDPLNMFFAPVKAASTAAKAGTKAGAKVATEAGEAAAKAAAPAGRHWLQNVVDPLRFSEMGQQLGGKILGESAEGIAKATDEGVSLMARATGRGMSKAAQKTGRLVERTGEAIAKSEREGLKRLGGFIKGMPAATKFAAVRTGMKAREFWNQAFNFAAKGAKFSETQKQFIDASLKAIEMDAADLDVLHKYLQTSARKRKDEILAEGGTFSRENEIEFFTNQNGLLSDAIEGKPGALELFDPEVQEVIAGIKGRQAQKRELLEQLDIRLRDFEDPVVDFMYRYLTEFQKDARIRETLGSRSKKGTGQLFSPFFREEVFRGAFSEDLKRVTSDDYIRQLIYGIQDGDDAVDVIRKVHEGKLDDSSLKPALNVETFELENGAESLVDSLRASELIGSTNYQARQQALLSDINKDLGELRDAAGGEIRTVAGLTPYGLRLELIADRMRQLGGASAGNISQHFRKITDDGKYFLHRNPEVEKTLSEIEAMGDWQYVTGGDDILFQSGDLVRYLPDAGAAPRFGVYTVENGVGKFREGVTRFSGDNPKIDVSINELELLTPKRALVENGKVVDTFVYEDRFDRLADYLIDHPESFEGGRGVFGNDPLADLEKGFQNSNWIVANFGVLKDMFVKGGKTILEPGDVFGQADLVDEVGRVLLAPKSLVPEGGSTKGIRLKDALFELFGYSVDVDDLLKEIAEANPQLLNKGRGSQGLLASVKQAEQNYTSLAEEMGALSPVPDSPWQSLLEGKFSREGLSEGASVLGDVALENMSLVKLKEMAKKLGLSPHKKELRAGDYANLRVGGDVERVFVESIEDGVAKIRRPGEGAEQAVSVPITETVGGPKTGADYFQKKAVDDALEEAAEYKSRSKVIEMSPDDFLRMAEQLPDGPSAEKLAGVQKLLSDEEEFSSIPRLVFRSKDGVAQVTTHEGRHRAMALRDRGVKSMPVELQGDIRWGEQAKAADEAVERMSDAERRMYLFDVKEVWPSVLKGESRSDDAGSLFKNEIPFPVPDLRNVPDKPLEFTEVPRSGLKTETVTNLEAIRGDKANLIKSIQEVPDQLLKSIAAEEGELTLKNLKAAVQDVVGAESTANQVQAYRAIESLMGVKTPGRNLAERGENILEALRDPKDVATELGGRVAEAERLYKNADKKLMDDVGNWQVNPELFNDITDVLSGAKASSDDFFPGGSQGAIANAFRSFTAMFKAGVLTWPARYTRDVAGGQINNMLNGMYSYRSSKNAWGVMHNKPLENLFDNPNEYASLRKYLEDQGIDPMQATGQQVTEAIQRLYAATKGHSSTVMRDIDFVGQEVVRDRILADLLDRGPGIGGEGLMGDLAIMGRAVKSGSWNPLDVAGVYSRAAKGPRATTEFGLAKSADLVGKMTDDFNRMSGFMELLRKGEDPLEAMKKVNRVQVDYNPSTFTPTEQALKRIFPFYSFMSRQGAYVTNELLTNPTGRLGNFIRAVRLGEGEDSRTLPEHVKATFALDVTDMPLVGGAEPGSSQYMTGFGLMFEDTINMLPTGGASNFFRDIVARTNPLLKGPLEWAFGRSSFQGGPMGGRDLASMDPSLGRIFTQLGIQDPLPNEQAAPAFGSRGLEFALANSPVSRLLSTVKGVVDTRKSPIQRASNALLGMKLTTVNQQQRRRGVRELMNARMKEAGVRPFETYQPSQEYIKGLPEGEERKALEIITALTKSFERERKAKKKAKQDGR